MVIKSAATHTNLDRTKALLSMAVEVTTLRCQNLLMKVQTIIDQKDTTVEPKVISIIFFPACLRSNNSSFKTNVLFIIENNKINSYFILDTVVCGSGWTFFEGHCYRRQIERMKYNEARADCSAQEAIIAVPNTKVENEFLATKMNSYGTEFTWIGFDYDNKELWEDGTTNLVTNDWRVLYEVEESDARNNGKPVVFMKPNGDWSFNSKDDTYQFICEKKLSMTLYRNIKNT